MPQRNYLTSTTALSLTASGTTVGSGNTTSITFEVGRTMVRTGINAGELADGSRTWSIHYVVSAMVTPYEMRLKLQRRNSAGVAQSESSYGTVRSTTGTFDDDITWDSGAWAANDQLALVWEHRRPSGTGNKSGTIDANGASYVDAALPIIVTTVTPAIAALTTVGLIARLLVAIVPVTVATMITRFAPSLRLTITPVTSSLTTTQLAPSLRTTLTPSTASLTTTRFAPVLHEVSTPVTQALSTTTFAPISQAGVTPATIVLTTAAFTPSLLFTNNVLIVVPVTTLTLAPTAPLIRPFPITFLDPGGDAVQAVGYFNAVVADGGGISYDTTQKVVGVGSYKFDSGASLSPTIAVNDVLGSNGRLSVYWRYDSVPDAVEIASSFFENNAVFSGGGFTDPANTNSDDGVYATATPARNAGQGSKMAAVGAGVDVPVGAVVDVVKIVYERKYDTNTSIGTSRVKWRINGVDGPDHDNTDMPLIDTVVEVDVTADRAWEWQDFTPGVLEVIAEARRGDTDIEHTQSWDYVKVEIWFHLSNAILATPKTSGDYGWQVAVTRKGSAVVLRFADGVGEAYDGITEIPINTQVRISLGYVFHGIDNFDIKIYLNGVEELSITGASTGGVDLLTNPDLHYGWIVSPGVDHICWFDQLVIDNGDDLSDIGNVLCTAKLSAAVNENNWNTVGGTGAVNERPLSEANYVEEATGIARLRQSYTLQTAATGDVDVSGQSLIGYMGWTWAKMSQIGEEVDLIVNNILVNRTAQITTLPSLLRHAITAPSYPSHAAGIGMRNAPELIDTFMYECGAVIAYRPVVVNPSLLMAYQVLAEGSTTTLTDDLRADPQDSYELCYRIDDGNANVLITMYSVPSEGQPPQLQGICGGQGGYGRTRITPGIEVQVVLEVTGGSVGVSVWRRVNIV